MKILALDTSSTACSVAVCNGQEDRMLHDVMPMQQAQYILPRIKALLDAVSMSFDQLDAVAYGCGPGSYTGIRIACSVAQTIAYAAHIPIIPVSSLAAIAQAAWFEHGCHKSLVAVDARMKQIYWGLYQVNRDGQVILVDQEQLCAPEAIKVTTEYDWQGVGDGWQLYTEQLISRLEFKPITIYPNQLPTADAVLALAKMKLAMGDIFSAFDATSTYLR